MLTRTSELAVRSLIFIALNGGDEPLSPRRISSSLDCSASYLAKILGLLAKAGILRSIRGVNGGVVLARPPESISLLEICEACQGVLIANYCAGISSHGDHVCSYHEAMLELHEATLKTLSKWTLERLMSSPMQTGPKGQEFLCRMFFHDPGVR